MVADEQALTTCTRDVATRVDVTTRALSTTPCVFTSTATHTHTHPLHLRVPSLMHGTEPIAQRALQIAQRVVLHLLPGSVVP